MVRESRRFTDSPNTRVSARWILCPGQEEILGVGFVKDIVGAIGDTAGGNANPYQFSPVVNQFSAKPMEGVDAAGGMLGNAQQNYGQQQGYIDMLRQQATGQGGPSVAENLLRQQTDTNNAQAASAIASQRGMNPALQTKLILDQQAQQQQQAAGQGATLRAGEQMQARGMLGSALGQQAGSNLGAGNLALGQQGQQLGNYWH